MYYSIDKFVYNLHPPAVTLHPNGSDWDQYRNVINDPVRVRLWVAHVSGDEAARAALIDWYEEHGITKG